MKAYPFQYAGGRYSYSIADNEASRFVIGERVVVKWRLHTLSDAEGNPYLFHLKPGEHTLEIRPVWGPALSGALMNINLARQELVQLETTVSEITARNNDLKKVDVAKEIPDLQGRIERMRTVLDDVARSLTSLSGGREPPVVERIKMIREELSGMAKKPRSVLDLLSPNKLDPSIQWDLADWDQADQAAAFGRTLRGRIEGLAGQQLQAAIEFDYIAIVSPDVEMKLPPRSPFRSLVKGWNRFVKSFSQEE
jgi:hypothetical protein